MSAEIEFYFLMDGIKDFFNKRQRMQEKLDREFRRNIENIKNDISKIQNLKSNLEEQKKKIIENLQGYVKYFDEINNIRLKDEILNNIELLRNANDILEISKYTSNAMQIYDDFQYEYETKLKEIEKEELLREYLTIKLKEMGQDVEIDEDGSIVSISDKKNIVINIEDEKIKVDIPGKSKTCALSFIEFERLTKGELQKGDINWHSSEKEKTLEKKVRKFKKIKVDEQIYNNEFISKEKEK